ncbi:MAG: nitroreductase [Eubacteriales bacterium]
MNEVLQTIFTRRSIRDFSPKTVPVADLETLIQAGLYAPSGMGRQTWKFVGLTNEDFIARLADGISTELSRENYNFYGAKTLILVSNHKDSPWGRDDNACALENMMLAGHSMGIGSVWINQLVGISYVPAIRAILDELTIPQDHEVYGILAVGYSQSEPKGQIAKIGEFSIIQ